MVFAVIVAALLATACVGDDGGPVDTVDWPVEHDHLHHRQQAVARAGGVVDRYIAYWDARLAAMSGTPNPQDSVPAEYTTGAQLIARPPRSRRTSPMASPSCPARNIRRVEVGSIEGDKAVVQECFVDDGLVVRCGNAEAWFCMRCFAGGAERRPNVRTRKNRLR